MSLATAEATVHFDGLAALTDVSMTLGSNEILGLIGPNGAGKTTLVNVLSGVQRLTSGTLLADGRPIRRIGQTRFARAGIARSFQSGRVFPRLTVEENLKVGAIGGGGSIRKAAARADELMSSMRLQKYRQELCESLPHGIQKKVDILRAFASRPRFVLLDEPAAGLNEAERVDLVASLARLQQETGVGMLVIEHDMNLIASICERVQVLDSGLTISVGTPDEVRNDPVVIAAYLGTADAERHA